jgi:hypothetical protein
LGRLFSLSAHSPLRHSHRAAPTKQQGVGAQCLVELELRPRFAILVPHLEDPTAAPEALLTGRVLHDSVERDIFADDDLSHLDSP